MAANFEQVKKEVIDICMRYGNDRSRLMDIVISLQQKYGCVSNQTIDLIASEVSAHRVEIEGIVSFYSFLSKEQKGKIIIRICDDIIDRLANVDKICKAFEKELGIKMGETTPDGKFTLSHTPCIGMCDQAPAALINDTVITNLSPDKVKEIIRTLKQGKFQKLVNHLGDGNNANPLINSMVCNHIRKQGEVIFAEFKSGDSLKKILSMTPLEVISEIRASGLRGRGGAGFPTGMKWDFTYKSKRENKTVICNADEGEPGTFKDRVILTECPDLLFEGMTIAGYAIGATSGILYLRGEYAYLRAFLEDVLNKRRTNGLLGNNICGKPNFNFNIRIQMGAGAYICGEETALISSCEGQRGDPKTRPPFPAEKGYLERPTVVNNVETFCCAARTINNGAKWFAAIGLPGCTGTKLLSVSGDCRAPGVYELPFGITINNLLYEVKAEDTMAVLVGGPTGQLINKADFGRKISYDDLSTGGSIMIFNTSRDILKIVKYFLDFFIEESCGYCTPCRVGNVLLKEKLKTIIDGKGEVSDIAYLENLGATIKAASRCGLGQASPNPILTSIKNFRMAYEKLLKQNKDKLNLSFNITSALKLGEKIAGRKSVIFKPE